MKAIHLKCPNCGAELKLDLKKKTAHCFYCSSDFYLQEGPEDYLHVSTVRPEGFDRQKLKANKRNYKPILIVTGIILLVNVAFAIIAGIMEDKKEDTLSTDQFHADTQSLSYEQETEPAAKAASTEPESEFMKQILALIFHKNYEEQSSDEWEKIKYLKVKTSLDLNLSEFVTTISYSFEDYLDYKTEDEFQNTVTSYQIMPDDKEGSLAVSDCRFLKNLTRLELPDEYPEAEDFYELSQLSYLSVDGTMETILAAVHPEQITSLDLDYSMDTLDGIGQFTNLHRLSLDSCSGVSDLTGLGELTELTDLSLIDLDDVTDVNALYQLTKLKSLVLDLEGLKELEFVENMTSLESLRILDGELLNYDVLKGNQSIKTLELDYNSNIKDLSPIATMTQLEDLSVPIYTCTGTEEFKNLTNLKRLYLSTNGNTSISYISKMKKLEELTLNNCYITDDLECLTGLEHLNKLKLSRVMNLGSLSALNKLKGLKEVDLSGNDCYFDITDLFSNETVEVLNLNQSSFEADFTQLYKLKNLKELDLNGVKLYTNVKVSSDGFFTNVDYDEQDINDYLPVIGKLENLQVLSMEDNQVTDISFLEGLDQLKVLNVKNNYIKDFEVLKSLKGLEKVSAQNNLGELPLLNGVVILTDSGHITND